MTRMIDRLYRQGATIPGNDNAELLVESSLTMAKRAVSVDVTNVADYFAINDKYNQTSISEDFWSAVPPWPLAFYEWREPKLWSTTDGPLRLDAKGIRRGALVSTIDTWKGAPEANRADQGRALTHDALSMLAQQYGLTIDLADMPWRWVLTFCHGISVESQPAVRFPLWLSVMGMTADGRVGKLNGDKHAVLNAPYAPYLLELEQQQAQDHMFTPLHIIILSNMFANAKGITVVDNVPPAKLNKATVKRHGVPLVRYYSLEIDPLRKRLEQEGQIATNGLKKALHLCRGHFATYTADKPLFGHYVGTVWVPAHMRGSLKQGAVIKDYRVKADVSDALGSSR